MKTNKIGLLGGALLLMTAFAGTQAKADRVAFAFNGGPFSMSYHSGWHHYWGGPTIGFYYAPAPVYVVAGYPDPYYYIGPDFWYANPAFGLSIGLGFGFGGGYHGGFDRNHDGAFRAAAARESLGMGGSSAFRGSESRAVSGGVHESGNGGSHVSDAASRAASARESVGFGSSRGTSSREEGSFGRSGGSGYGGGRSESYGGEHGGGFGGEHGGGFGSARGGGVESHGSGGGGESHGGGHR